MRTWRRSSSGVFALRYASGGSFHSSRSFFAKDHHEPDEENGDHYHVQVFSV